jgi:hypothetical protein
VAAALRSALTAPPLCRQLFLAEDISGAHDWSALLGGHVLERKASPVLALDFGAWEDFLSSRSSHFRQEMRRKERRLLQEGFVYRFANAPSQLDRDLDACSRSIGGAGGPRHSSRATKPFSENSLTRQ